MPSYHDGYRRSLDDPEGFWADAARAIDWTRAVTAMFTAPTAIRAIRTEDPEARLLAVRDTSRLRHLFLAGERLDPRRLPACHGPHRRRAERRRPPVVGRRDGGGRRLPPGRRECTVIGVADQIKGQIPHGYVVLKAGADTDADTLRAEIVAMVRDRIGPVAALREIHIVAALPTTRSGKILRRTMRDIADGRDTPIPSTIDDPAVIDALRPPLCGRT